MGRRSARLLQELGQGDEQLQDDDSGDDVRGARLVWNTVGPGESGRKWEHLYSSTQHAKTGTGAESGVFVYSAAPPPGPDLRAQGLSLVHTWLFVACELIPLFFFSRLPNVLMRVAHGF